MYTFPSAAEDIALNINLSNQGVAMSHYALLNLNKNNFEYDDANELLKSLQNDLMNNEVVLLNQSTYNVQEPQTVSEYVFWKWINDHSKGQFSPRQLSANPGIYRESNYRWNDSDRIVQCFGAVDAGNYLSTEFGMFNETYVSVPTSYGNGPVFFRSVADNINYKKNNTYQVGTIIQGRENTSRTYISGANPLRPLSSTYNDPYAFEIVKDIPTIQRACQEVISPSVVLTSIDDVNIDSTNQFAANPSYAISNKPCEFKFNAILLYYSLYDLSDVKKEAIATNLFSVIFLDGIQTSNLYDNYSIAPVIKKKSYNGLNSDASYFGSGYAFRVNIKTMSVYDNTDAVIEDNSTATSAYSQDFNDVLSNLNKAIDVMNTNMRTTAAIQDAYMSMRAELVDYQQKIEDYINTLKGHLEDIAVEKVSKLKEEIEDKLRQMADELEITDVTDSTPTDGTGVALKRNISTAAVVKLAKRMGITTDTYSVSNPVNSISLADKKIDIISKTTANLNAQQEINLTGSDVNVNFKSDGQISTVKLSDLITRVNDIEKELETQNSEDKVLGASESRDLSLEKIVALGIIPVNEILQARAKKPEVPGLYLKTNTAGLIQTYVLFDGEDYKETVKCEQGKMYSVKGTIYVFDGETCKPLGS